MLLPKHGFLSSVGSFFILLQLVAEIPVTKSIKNADCMRVAIIGATGLVGREMAAVLEKRTFPAGEIIPVASPASAGHKLHICGKDYEVKGIEQALSAKPHLALFSAGADISRNWAQEFTQQGCVVIDNSSAWRNDVDIPLVVPEVNSHVLSPQTLLISNPNCSTIQLVVALNPVYKAYGIKRLVISTYQSVSGTGQKAVQQLRDEQQGKSALEAVYPHPIHENLIPHAGQFDEEGYTTEERKLEHETRKIMGAPEIAVTATVVRVPVLGGHSISVNIETEREFSIDDIRQLLLQGGGIVLQDEPKANIYPMPLFAQGRDEVFVGRLRKDNSHPKAFNMWIVADNLRKGAATNAVQIAEIMLNRNFLPAF